MDSPNLTTQAAFDAVTVKVEVTTDDSSSNTSQNMPDEDAVEQNPEVTSSLNPENSDLDQNPDFICKHCEKKFPNKQALGGHQNAHRAERALNSIHDGSHGFIDRPFPLVNSHLFGHYPALQPYHRPHQIQGFNNPRPAFPFYNHRPMLGFANPRFVGNNMYAFVPQGGSSHLSRGRGGGGVRFPSGGSNPNYANVLVNNNGVPSFAGPMPVRPGGNGGGENNANNAAAQPEVDESGLDLSLKLGYTNRNN